MRPPWLYRIVAQAQFLRERTETKGAPIRHAGPDAAVEERRARWRARLGSSAGDGDPLPRRLALQGLGPEGTEAALADIAPLAPGEPLPAWADLLLRISGAAPAVADAEGMPPPLRADDPIPFDRLLLPAVLAGRALLEERIGHLPADQAQRVHGLLSDAAMHALERALLAHLAISFAKVLQAEFSRRRSFGENLLSELDLAVEAGSSSELYEGFVREMLAAGLVPLLEAYPVLARLMATAVGFWVDSGGDFLERLARHRPDLRRRFAPDDLDPGRVVALDPLLSDRHEGGRSVIALTFENGLRLVYKPRGLGLHTGFNRFLDYCNRHSGLPELETLAVLDCGDFGLARYAAHRPCSNRGEVADFYRRAGMLLCALHALRATDCHNENVIASGPQPILVDVETLLHPRDATPGAEPAAVDSALHMDEHFYDSVLRTGMLPHWRFGPDQRTAFDLSALGGSSPQRVPQKVERWTNVNRDTMALRQVDLDFPLERNLPWLDGTPCDPTEFRDEIVYGFGAMYDFLLAHRDALLREDGPLQGLRGQRVRYVFRNSQVYGSVLQEAQTPAHLRDGREFGIALDALSQAFVAGAVPERGSPLLDAELRALERQDIPIFWSDTAGTDLIGSDGIRVPAYFSQASHDDVCDRLQRMGDTDRALQSAIVKGAFDALAARSPTGVGTAATEPESVPLSDDELLAEAVAIGDEICARAISDARGRIAWLGFGYAPEAERYQHQVLGDRLYDGIPGVSLFLAALFDATGRAYYADMARSALADLREKIATMPPAHRARDLGGTLGLGATIYALTATGTLLRDSALLQDALNLANSISPREVEADHHLDTMGGVAGCILGLAALHRATSSPRVAELARLCGKRLLAAETEDAWPTLGDIPLTGMSHGAAGISYALVSLHALAGGAEFLDAALRGIAYERRLFDAASSRWTDLRPPLPGGERGEEPVQWCHGAAGIGLARIGCARLLSTASLDGDIDAAIAATVRTGIGEVDHLCCGNFGRIELLLAAAPFRRRDHLRVLARGLASRVVRRARDGGGYRLFGNLGRGVWNPGLFQGMAGIGYELLRVRNGALRSFALWE